MKIVKEEIKRQKERIFKDYSYIKCKLTRNSRYYRFKLVYWYFIYVHSRNILKKFFSYRKYSKYSTLLNVQIVCENILYGFSFNHGNIVIHKDARIGKNFHCTGNNCIGGNKNGAPTIGDNVSIGYGAIVLGNVTIADNVKVGAGALVTKDCLIPGCTIINRNEILKK